MVLSPEKRVEVWPLFGGGRTNTRACKNLSDLYLAAHPSKEVNYILPNPELIEQTIFFSEKNWGFPRCIPWKPTKPTSLRGEVLETHAEHVRETLRLAASLGRVAIVTLAALLGHGGRPSCSLWSTFTETMDNHNF